MLLAPTSVVVVLRSITDPLVESPRGWGSCGRASVLEKRAKKLHIEPLDRTWADRRFESRGGPGQPAVDAA